MPALVFNGVKEHTVNGRLYHHIVSHIGHPLYGTGNRRNDAGTEDQPLFINGKSVLRPTVLNGFLPFSRHHRIAENPFGCFFHKTLRYLGCSLKIHIRHPHGELFFLHIPF